MRSQHSCSAKMPNLAANQEDEVSGAYMSCHHHRSQRQKRPDQDVTMGAYSTSLFPKVQVASRCTKTGRKTKNIAKEMCS